ncbi:MAG TPA: hypothetical protein VMU73_03460, partial [Gaiellaceae bacterium]|nr:hypothetical protein [Gaiellaceae bacterium]
SHRAGKLTVRDLLKGALIQSANDAADALALSIAPDFPAFARMISRSINKPGVVSRLGWYAGRTFHHLAGLL